MDKRIFPFALFAAVFAVLVGGCAQVAHLTDYVRVQFGNNVEFVEPPASAYLFGYSSLSLSSDDNAASREIADKARARISSLMILDQPFYQLDEAHSESVKIVINGALVEVSDYRKTEERFRCPGSGVVRRCSSDEAIRYNVSCQVREAVGSAKVVMTDVASGEAIVSKQVRSTADDKLCSDAGNDMRLASAHALTERVLAGLEEQVLGPYVFSVAARPFDLRRSSELMGEDDNARMTDAIVLANEGNISGAIAVYQDLADAHPNDGALLFNLAYLQHAVGRYADALDLYDRAEQTEQLPGALVTRNRERANEHVLQGYLSIPERQRN